MRRAVALLIPPLLTGCPVEQECGLLPVYEGGAVVSMDACTGQLALGTADDPQARLPVAPEGASPLGWADDDLVHSMSQGRYTFEGVFGLWKGFGGGTVEGATWTSEGGDVLTVSEGPRGSTRLRLEAAGEVDRVSIAFGCNDGEHFYGLGARPQGTDHTGTTQLLYTAEQGIGQADYPLYESDLLRGRTGDTYFPVPWTVTDRGTGVAIDNDQVGRMYLCGEDEPNVLRFESWGQSIDLLLFAAASPRQAVADWTLASGPPVAAPDWAFGPWVALQHGADELVRTAQVLREHDIPATALWAQDWIGGDSSPLFGYDLHYHWEWDQDLYPGLPGLIDDLHASGFAFLGYFNPFITDEFREWDEARDSGYLPRTPEGDFYEFAIVYRYGSVVDLSNPDAWDWALGYLRAAAEMGQDGWMCDFAEWMPFDAQVDAGSGQDLHNRYPLLWQQLNMQALDEVHGAGNALCFNRSGWAGTQALAPVTWPGDQETSFARDDGMPTAREIGVGLGLSGVGRFGSDIAGYSSQWTGPSDRELYWRWVELGAFEPVMRTHDGLRADDNWHWEADAETLEHFARYARLHMRLLPYLKLLDADYRERGLPLMRHNLIVADPAAPNWAALRDAPDQHFLGDDLLIAPILDEGAVERTVVLPPGRWYHFLDAGSWDGGGVVTVPAPLGSTPVLARGGSVLPLGDPDVMTSYPASDADVVDTADRADRLHLVAFAGGSSTRDLGGGASLSFAGESPDPTAPVTLGGALLNGECPSDTASDCIESASPDGLVARVNWPPGASTLAGAGWSLDLELPEARSGSFVLRN